MHVIDLEGNEYVLQATSTNYGELNGNQSFSAKILPSKVNNLFIKDITEMWNVVDHDEVEHKIIYAKRKGKGNLLNVDIKAIPLFFDTLDNDRIYDRYDEHMTAQLAFTRIFKDTGFTFVLNGNFSAVEWEGFGDGESKLETFKRALNRYKCEFRISGNTVYLESQIGRDTQHQYRHRLNASNIIQEIDANEMWTYAKGYGDYGDGEDWENAKLEREYTSPLAKILGKRHAPPIKNGNITTKSKMDEELKTLVDESLKISVSADIYDLQKQGYPIAQSQLGDRVFLIDERIGLNDEVRVVNHSITRNWKGKVVDVNPTFGSEGITKRHQSEMSTAIKNITELLDGKIQLPFDAYDNAVKDATKALKGITSELTVPSNGGLMAVDKDDPNNVVLYNAAGIGVSDDGGATFKNSITGNGVVAETVIGKSLIGLNMTSADESGYFHVNGSDAEFFDTNTNRYVSISPSGLYGYNSNNNIRFQADSSLVTSAAFGTSNSNVYLASSDGGEARVVRFTSLPGDGTAGDYTYRDMRSLSVKSPPGRNAYIGTDGELRVMSEGLSSSDVYRDVRMGRLYANTHEVRGGSVLYLRSDDRVRIMGEGESGAYKDLQLAHIQAQSIRKNTAMGGNHFYLGVDQGELRVKSNGLADGTYRDVRASDFKQSSSREFKKNVKKYDKNATNELCRLNIVNFDYIDGEANRVGVISEESPEIGDGDSVSLGDTMFLNTKAIQELNDRLTEMEDKLNG